MQKYLFICFLIFPYSASFAQYHALKEKMAEQKAKQYQQMMLCEQQITANQESYDAKYYALDLIPDPATSILSGVVEIVGEVIAPISGNKSVVWDGTDNSAKPVSSGLYFYMLETAKFTETKKMVLMR